MENPVLLLPILPSKNELEPTSLKAAFVNFGCFFFYWFSLGIQRVDGFDYTPDHLWDVCDRLQFNRRTSTQAPRFHLKSTVTEGFVAWKMWRMERIWNEWDYMSYTADLGEYHTKRMKRYIQEMPEIFEEYKSLSDAESIIYYQHGKRKFICAPCGIMSFKRGRHPTGMICDDILKDPAVKLDLSQLKKIERAFVEEVENMPREDLHLVGTPQDQEDLFFQKQKDPKFNCKIYTAEADPTNKVALWENNPSFAWEELMKKRAANLKMYLKEYMCMPVRATDAFISLDQMNALICSRLKNYPLTKPPIIRSRTVVGGFDIGKKTHPSHFAIFVQSRRKYLTRRIDKQTNKVVEKMEHRLIQVHSKFMDGWDYIDQIEYIKNAISIFKIDKLFYDNTRSEFESTDEAGNLPGEMEGVSFTVKEKFSMATEMDIAFTQKIILLLNDDRQKRQMLSVDCDLKAQETEEGHGDAFFSVGLAIKAWRDASSILVWSPGQN